MSQSRNYYSKKKFLTTRIIKDGSEEYDFLSSEEDNSSLPSNANLESDTADNDAMESDPDDILTEKSPPKKHKSYAEIEVRPGRRKGAFSASQLLLMETPKSRGGSYRCTLGSQKSRSSSVLAKLKKPQNSSTSPTPNSKHLAIPSSLQSSPSSLHSSPVNTSSPTVPARWSPSSNDHRPYQEVENLGASGGVMSALKDVTGLLNTLVKRVEENAKDIQSIQKALNSGTNSTESSPKHHVPSIVRVS